MFRRKTLNLTETRVVAPKKNERIARIKLGEKNLTHHNRVVARYMRGVQAARNLA